MPNPLNNATCGDDYTAAATISDVWQSRGGWFSVASHSVYVQQQYGDLGTPTWTGEQLLGAGASGYMAPACRGIRFRNATAGSVASVSAAIAEGNEPPLSVLSLGTTVVVPSSLNFQLNDVQVATEPTVDFEDAANLTWAVVDDAANTRVKVTPAVTLLSTSQSTPVGYTTGAGGSGIEAGLAVTVNALSGQITLAAHTVGANGHIRVTVTNSTVLVDDGPYVWQKSGGIFGISAYVTSVGAGTFDITLSNVTTGSLSTSGIVLGFLVLSAATS